MSCERCGGAHDHATPLCCSSHRKALCHACYRVTHLVEVCDCALCASKTTDVTTAEGDTSAPYLAPR